MQFSYIVEIIYAFEDELEKVPLSPFHCKILM